MLVRSALLIKVEMGQVLKGIKEIMEKREIEVNVSLELSEILW